MLTDYTTRLPNQFQDSDNLKNIINIFYDKIKEGNDIIDYLLSIDLDGAEGVWLDEIGEIVGIPRASEQMTDSEIFAYCAESESPGDITLGYSDLSDPQGGYFLGLDEDLVPTAPTGVPLSDTDYRTLIRAKIYATISEDTIPAIYTWIFNTLGVTSYVYTSNPCEVAVELDEYLTFYERWVLLKFAPIAAGVRLWIVHNPPEAFAQIEDEEEVQ